MPFLPLPASVKLSPAATGAELELGDEGSGLPGGVELPAGVGLPVAETELSPAVGLGLTELFPAAGLGVTELFPAAGLGLTVLLLVDSVCRDAAVVVLSAAPSVLQEVPPQAAGAVAALLWGETLERRRTWEPTETTAKYSFPFFALSSSASSTVSLTRPAVPTRAK